MRIRTVITNDDLLTLQNCCDIAGHCTLEIGGPPTPFDARLNLERLAENGRSRTDWMWVYLNCDKRAYALAVEAMFRRTTGIGYTAEALAA